MQKNTFSLRKPVMNKKGQIGMNLVKNVMISFLILGVIFVAIALALVQLRNANLFTPGTPEANNVNDTIRNITAGGASFFANTTAIFNILFVVVIIAAIAIVIAVVSGFQGGGGSSTGL